MEIRCSNGRYTREAGAWALCFISCICLRIKSYCLELCVFTHISLRIKSHFLSLVTADMALGTLNQKSKCMAND